MTAVTTGQLAKPGHGIKCENCENDAVIAIGRRWPEHSDALSGYRTTHFNAGPAHPRCQKHLGDAFVIDGAQ